MAATPSPPQPRLPHIGPPDFRLLVSHWRELQVDDPPLHKGVRFLVRQLLQQRVEHGKLEHAVEEEGAEVEGQVGLGTLLWPGQEVSTAALEQRVSEFRFGVIGLTTPHHTTPHHTSPHHTTPHHTTPHHTTPHRTTPHHIADRKALCHT